MKVFGKKLLSQNRKVLWREDVIISNADGVPEDSLVEMSKFKNKFYIT